MRWVGSIRTAALTTASMRAAHQTSRAMAIAQTVRATFTLRFQMMAGVHGIEATTTSSIFG